VFPRILHGGRVIAQIVAAAEGTPIEMRWPNLPTMAIACVGLDDDQERWRVALPSGEQIPLRPDTPRERKAAPLSTGPLRIGQSVLAGDALFLFGASGIGASKFTGQIACIDTKTARLRWVNWTGTRGYNMVARNDQPYWFTPSTLFTADPHDGTVSSFWTAGFNNRCNRSAATDEWLINGMGIWVDRQGQAVVRSIARSGCAQGPTIAQGLVLYTPNTCSCITQLRGHLALSAEAVRPPPEEAARLRRDGGAVATAASPASALAGPIAAEWPLQFFAGRRETAPVNDDAGRTYVGVIHEHRLECRRGSALLWAFTAGGRISHAPVRHGDTVLFGSHDGWAYCLDVSTGALRWRFYAGGAERQIVSHGQVESSWPVYNVVMHDGLACFTAGLHPETGGGIHAWGLDPSNGQVRWRHRLARTEIRLAQEKGKISPNRVLNCPLQIDENGRLAIIGLSFSPAEDAAAIQQRIDTAGLGDAGRNDGGWTLRGEAPGRR
jgi:outer membrane protein assembly factor BamB